MAILRGCWGERGAACGLLLAVVLSCSNGEQQPSNGGGDGAQIGNTGGATTATGSGASGGVSSSTRGGTGNGPPPAGDGPIGGDGGGGNSSSGDGGDSSGMNPGGADAGGTNSSGGAAGGGSSAVGECGEITTFDRGREPSREIFVDADAAGGGDGSEASPYSTLDEALADATPGTAIRLLPGTYAGGTFGSDISGTADAPIWIGGASSATPPTISGGGTAFQLSAVSYLVIHDLVVTGQSDNGINVDDGGDYGSEVTHHVVFRNVAIRDVGSGGNQDCLKLSGVNDFVVVDSEFSGCSGSAIDHVGCHRGLIARCEFEDLLGNGVQSKGGSEDIEIRQNRFIEAGQRAVNLGGSTGFEFFRPPLSTSEPNFEARNLRVVSNLFQGGISPVAFVGCVECLVANNTIVAPVQWVFRILQETTTDGDTEFLPARDGRFVNNLIYFSRGDLSTYVNVGGNTAPETFQLSNNLWYASDDPAASEPTPLPAPESDGIYGLDPDLATDFSIDEASPASGAGTQIPETLGDLRGNCFADPPSVGAYEAQ